MREESDFLTVRNHQGEMLDFHSPCAIPAAHGWPCKAFSRTLSRPSCGISTITLTMDTYGHLLPDQHADAVGGMAKMLAEPLPVAATGTTGQVPAVQSAVGMRKDPPSSANGCDAMRDEDESLAQGEERKPLRIADVCEAVQENATGRGGIRTHTPVTQEGILSPQCLPFHHAAQVRMHSL